MPKKTGSENCMKAERQNLVIFLAQRANKSQTYVELLEDLSKIEKLNNTGILKNAKQPETSVALLELKDSKTAHGKELAAMKVVDILTAPRPVSPSWSFN